MNCVWYREQSPLLRRFGKRHHERKADDTQMRRYGLVAFAGNGSKQAALAARDRPTGNVSRHSGLLTGVTFELVRQT